MNPQAVIEKLNATGAVVYLYGDTTGYPVARMGITPGGRLWYQNGTAAHLGGAADAMVEDGCAYVWKTREGKPLSFVLPEDADDWELGALVTRLGEDRQAITREDLLETLE